MTPFHTSRLNSKTCTFERSRHSFLKPIYSRIRNHVVSGVHNFSAAVFELSKLIKRSLFSSVFPCDSNCFAIAIGLRTD